MSTDDEFDAMADRLIKEIKSEMLKRIEDVFEKRMNSIKQQVENDYGEFPDWGEAGPWEAVSGEVDDNLRHNIDVIAMLCDLLTKYDETLIAMFLAGSVNTVLEMNLAAVNELCTRRNPEVNFKDAPASAWFDGFITAVLCGGLKIGSDMHGSR